MPGDRFIELATAEDRRVLEILFGPAAEAVTVQDRSGRILFANDAAAEMLGFKKGSELMALPAEAIVSDYEIIARSGEPMPIEALPGRRVMAGEPYAEAIVGYLRKGSRLTRWSHLRSSPIKNDRREVALVINFFSDITAQVKREDAEQVEAAVYQALGSSLDQEHILEAAARTLIPRMATWCSLHVVEGDRLEPVAVAYPSEDGDGSLIHTDREGAISLDEDRMPARVVRSRKPEVGQVSEEMIRNTETRSGAELGKVLRRLGLGPVACVPMSVGPKVIGTLTVARVRDDPDFEDVELALLEVVADRAAATLENARLFEQQLHIAETLQSVLTPRELPEIPGLELAARYRPLSLVGHVGGDFYDVVPAPGRGYAVLVGDIAGKGVEAAAAVGLARYTLRSTIALDPGCITVATQINEALLDEDRISTLAYVFIEPDDRGLQAQVMLAGHPPPILITAQGQLRRLGQPCPPAGLVPVLTPTVETHPLEAGDTLLLYTDGFTLPNLDPPASVELAISKCRRDNPDQLVDEMISLLFADSPEASDDVALLAFRVADRGPDGAGPRFSPLLPG